MIKEVLQSIDGNVDTTIVGLIIFVLAFSGVLLWTLTLDKKIVEEMRAIPFATNDGIESDGIELSSVQRKADEDNDSAVSGRSGDIV